MNKNISLLLLISTFVLANEVSVFNAGNLDSKNPYGLNASEKHILKNQKKISGLSSQINDIKSLIESMKGRLEGLESTYEGDSSKLNSTVIKMNKMIEKLELSSELATKNSTETAEIKNVSEQLLNMSEENEKQMKKSMSTLKKAISQLSNLVNKINSEYVSSAELKKNMNQFVTRSEFEALKKLVGVKNIAKNEKKEKSVENKKLTSEDKEKLLVKAKAEFKRRYFNGAIPKFEKLISLNFKPAESNYYLGEMWYVRKKYDLAISHFKKSAILYDKAAYMPTLLLHSAISFEKTDDMENAKSFYATLIDLYPNTSQSKIAKKNISKL